MLLWIKGCPSSIVRTDVDVVLTKTVKSLEELTLTSSAPMKPLALGEPILFGLIKSDTAGFAKDRGNLLLTIKISNRQICLVLYVSNREFMP